MTLLFFLQLRQAGTYTYVRIGNQRDVQVAPTAGIAMMGGGHDLDEAFRWLCNKARGGDFLILRAAGDDEYNGYVNGICRLNSVATLIIANREAAQNSAVADIVRNAEAIFIAGGDQARYVNFWQNTPVQDAINTHVASGKPIGGTSAGLAILGQYSYGALGDAPTEDDLASKDVLLNPYLARVTLVRDFLKLPGLENLITDSHFRTRDRMGRSLVFLARIMHEGWSAAPREIAIDETSAVLVEVDGTATVIGSGRGAYFIHPTEAPRTCRQNAPLTIEKVAVYHAPNKAHFDLRGWYGGGGNEYSLSVEGGALRSTQAGGGIY